MTRDVIIKLIKKVLKKAYPELQTSLEVKLEHPTDLSHGDYSTNMALVLAKEVGKNPKELATELAEKLNEELPDEVERITVAGPGFINFHLKIEFLHKVVKIITDHDMYGRTDFLKGTKAVFEYTDPNPFKQFHIGHLMSNAIGEALSRIYEWHSAEVKRVCYQGDVGRHVALAIYGIRLMKEPFPDDSKSLPEKVAYLGKAYALGATKFKDDPSIESDVQRLNKKIYDGDDEEVNELYEKGREWSLLHFEELYKKLGTKFDRYIFESEASPLGLSMVKENIGNVFEESEGAVIFPGEKYDLHTRVFITKEGLPTYEAKELGLSKIKYEAFPFEKSIIMTATEQNAYFEVVLKALSLIEPKIAATTSHVSHGMLRLPTGKMSSRTGDVITGESLIIDAEERVREKMKERNFNSEEESRIAQQVAVGAIKYSILKQSPGKDIIFDMEQALSFEGDSGPYLQYSYVRANSVLEKLDGEVKFDFPTTSTKEQEYLEKIVYRLPEITEQAIKEMAPQNITTYLIELAAAFNSYYATNKILDAGDDTPYRIALTKAFATVMENGLTILGIPSPDKM